MSSGVGNDGWVYTRTCGGHILSYNHCSYNVQIPFFCWEVVNASTYMFSMVHINFNFEGKS